MTTINLYQNKENDESSLRTNNLNSGLIFSVFLVIFSVALVFALKAGVSFLEKKNQTVQAEAQREKSNLAGLSSLELVVDLQNRLERIKSSLAFRADMTKILENLQTSLNTNVVVSSYKYENGKILVVFDSNNFNDLARQIQSFKKSENFANVDISNIKRKNSTISCEVRMDIKNKI